MIILIGEHFPLLQLLSETLQAATPRVISIRAFKTIVSPAFETGLSTEIQPSAWIFVCINKLSCDKKIRTFLAGSMGGAGHVRQHHQKGIPSSGDTYSCKSYRQFSASMTRCSRSSHRVKETHPGVPTPLQKNPPPDRLPHRSSYQNTLVPYIL